MTCFEELEKRGVIKDTSSENVKKLLNSKDVVFYAGFDPTAASLQLGNLAIIITQMRLQSFGHKPIALLGGATGMIGDPSGKSKERNLLDEEILLKNIEAQRNQFLKLFKNDIKIVNNIDWTKDINLIDFLRTIGKNFRLSEMLAKDSVKSRLNSEEGISFTEFTYQMIQANDFAQLAKEENVTLQIGGSDQWGNMTAGIDLAKKLHGKEVFVMTSPLLTNSQGKKFGKSEGGETIFLDKNMTSPFKMFQFLLNTADDSVIKFLKYLTFIPLEEIDKIEKSLKTEPHLRVAQRALAEEIVNLVHGKEELEKAKKASEIFFGKEFKDISSEELEDIFSDAPSIEASIKDLEKGIDSCALLSETPLFKSKGDARRSINQNGVAINNIKMKEARKFTKNDLASENILVVKKGKKNFCLIKFN